MNKDLLPMNSLVRKFEDEKVELNLAFRLGLSQAQDRQILTSRRISCQQDMATPALNSPILYLNPIMLVTLNLFELHIS